MSCILWLIGGIVLGVVFDQFFTRVWRRIKAKGEEVIKR